MFAPPESQNFKFETAFVTAFGFIMRKQKLRLEPAMRTAQGFLGKEFLFLYQIDFLGCFLFHFSFGSTKNEKGAFRNAPYDPTNSKSSFLDLTRPPWITVCRAGRATYAVGVCAVGT